jgi:hypothetical protein
LISVDGRDSSPDGVSAVAVAYGLGDMAFSPAAIEERFYALIGGGFEQGEPTGPEDPSSSAEYGYHVWPLAAGDLDADGDADMVMPNGIWLQQDNEFVFVKRPQNLYFWSEAIITDLNLDGLGDVAAVGAFINVVGIEMLMSAVFPAVVVQAHEAASASIVTHGMPYKLRAADFDGDYIGDLAFLELGTLGDASLSILDGKTLEQRSLGKVGVVEHLEAAEFVGDQYRDLMLVMNEGTLDQPDWSLSVLIGNGEGRLISPLIFENTEVEDQRAGGGFASRVVLGHLNQEDQNFDLIALQRDGFWVAPGTGDARFITRPPLARFYGLDVVIPDAGYITDSSCAQFARANFDASNSEDEILAVAAANCITSKEQSRDGTEPGGMQLPASSKPQMIVVGGTPAEIKAATFELPEDLASITAVHVSDLDGNGRPDVAIAYQSVAQILGQGSIRTGGEAEGGPTEAKNGVMIYWNAQATFGAAPAITSEAQSKIDLPANERPRALTAINADADAVRELAVLTHGAETMDILRALAWVKIVDFQGTAVGSIGEPVISSAIATVSEPQLASADVDQDGLEDLLFGDSTQLYIYRATSAKEGRVE